MTREEAHEMIDKVLDSGYCGSFVLNCFKGNVSTVGLNQVLKSSHEMVLFSIG